MANVIKCTQAGGGSDATIQWTTFPTGQTVYVTFECYISSADLVSMRAGGSGQLNGLGEIGYGSGGTQDLYLYDDVAVGTYDAITDDLMGPTDGLLGDTWQTLEWSMVPNGGTLHQRVDATDNTQSFSGFGGQIHYVILGAYFRVDGTIYIRTVKIGTTPGGSDVVNYDPATGGDPGTFGFTVNQTSPGSVSLVSDPSSPPPPPDPDFGPYIGTGTGDDPGDLDGVYYIDHLDHDCTTILQTIRPENPDWELNIRDPDTINYEISLGAKDINGADIISHDFIGAWRTCWQLRYGSVVISAGPHTLVNGVYGEDFMKVSGISWLGYFGRRFYPFDPRHTPTYATTHVNDYIIGSPPQGLAYEVQNVDASIIAKALFDVIMARPYNMPITYTRADLTVNVPHYSLALGDNTTYLSQLEALSEFDPGFDYWVAPMTRQLRLAAPYRFGTPASIVAGGATGAGIKQIFTNDPTLLAEPNASDALELEFTNTGPEGTHLFGLGAGLGGNQLGIGLGLSTNQAVFWRTDTTYEAGDVKDRHMLEAMSRKQFSLGLQPVHEIPVTVDPGYITDFWTNVRAGVAIWLKFDLGFHMIDSPQRVVKIAGGLDSEGNVKAALTLNQIYDTDPTAGDYEG